MCNYCVETMSDYDDDWEDNYIPTEPAYITPAEPPKPWSPRESVLDEAKHLTTGDRNNQYGPPTQDFSRIAEILTTLGFRFITTDDGVGPIEPHHVSMIMISLKLSRLTHSPEKRDSWVDLAGYAACGYECVEVD